MLSLSIKETTSMKLDKEAKENAKVIFRELGITMGDAFNMFLKQVNLHQGLPFEVKIPNKETLKAIKEAKENINLEETSIEEMLAQRETLINA
jgi:DNA-damage-inducible protein J